MSDMFFLFTFQSVVIVNIVRCTLNTTWPLWPESSDPRFTVHVCFQWTGKKDLYLIIITIEKSVKLQ